MAGALENANKSPKKRKPRASRGRGLRTTTGCLTCRKRRLKCDEARPTCGQCSKSDRECVLLHDLTSTLDEHSTLVSKVRSPQTSWGDIDSVLLQNLQRSPEASIASHERSSDPPPSTFAHNVASVSLTESGSLGQDGAHRPASQDHQSQLDTHRVATHEIGYEPRAISVSSPNDVAVSPVTQAASVTPGQAPYEWWDLVAHDAAKSAQSYQALKNSHSRWSFEPIDLSRSTAPSPGLFVHSGKLSQEQAQPMQRPLSTRGNGIGSDNDNVAKEPWNTSVPVVLPEQEITYLKYYIDHVGPMFDLFDPERTFTEYIPHLAMRNVGLLKSVLAVSARFKSLHACGTTAEVQSEDNHCKARPSFTSNDDTLSTQFYFETLNYLSQAMQYQSYTRSQEILATATLISSYEMFHVNRSTDWDKHLKGVFWIQRSQDTNGERGGLRAAVWWNWLRQDIWAALWQKRKPLTIWEPTKPIGSLSGHEFATRATYLLARAVKYATQDVRDSIDLSQRIAEGEKHLQDLQEWYSNLPPTYRPLPAVQLDRPIPTFPSIWIHPSYHAAAMQYYYSAKLLVLLHRPSSGGINAYHDAQRMLNEAVSMICGLAQSPTALELPSAMVHFQALYVAGHCVRTVEQQKALYDIFEHVLDASQFPTKSLLTDLQKVWTTF